MNINEVLGSTNIKAIITIDDDWDYHEQLEAILYDIYYLDTHEKDKLYRELEIVNSDSALLLKNAIDEIAEIGFKDVDLPQYKIFEYLRDPSLINNIPLFTEEFAEELKSVFQRYGVGLKSTGISHLKDVISYAKSNKIPIRVYTDYLDSDKESFKKDVEELTRDGGHVWCIIDDQMGNEKRSDEIISTIVNNERLKNNVACVLLTSKNNKPKERFDKDIHVEFVQKVKAGNIINSILISYIRSLYRIMILNLQKAKEEAISDVFNGLYQDVNVASFISAQAYEEGVTNFDMVNKWIVSKERDYIENKKVRDIINIISLANVLHHLEIAENWEDETPEDNDMYLSDIYDKTVNALHKSIDIGDIFEVNGKYYVLVGQECDLSIRKNGKRKTEVLEFVKAEIFDSTIKIIDSKTTIEQIVIPKFPLSEGTMGYISIDCGKRYYGKPEIFDMCAFNESGESRINRHMPINSTIKSLLSPGLITLYSDIQNKYNSYLEFKEMIGDNDKFDEFVKSVELSNKNNQVIGYTDFSNTSGEIIYNVKRIYRLRKHAHLLHRLYLNYRGRQAEEAVCYTRQMEFKYRLGNREYEAKCMLSTKSAKNEEELLYKRPWRIKVSDVNEHLKLLGKNLIDDGSEYIDLDNSKCNMYGLSIKKRYNKSHNQNELVIE